MTLLMRLRCLLGRTETLLQLLRDLLEPSGMYIFDFFDDLVSLRYSDDQVAQTGIHCIFYSSEFWFGVR